MKGKETKVDDEKEIYTIESERDVRLEGREMEIEHRKAKRGKKVPLGSIAQALTAATRGDI